MHREVLVEEVTVRSSFTNTLVPRCEVNLLGYESIRFQPGKSRPLPLSFAAAQEYSAMVPMKWRRCYEMVTGKDMATLARPFISDSFCTLSNGFEGGGKYAWEVQASGAVGAVKYCVWGICTFPLDDHNWSTSPNIWAIRAKAGERFHMGRVSEEFLEPITDDAVCRFELDLEQGELWYGTPGKLQLAFAGLPTSQTIYPFFHIMRNGRSIKLLRVEDLSSSQQPMLQEATESLNATVTCKPKKPDLVSKSLVLSRARCVVPA